MPSESALRVKALESLLVEKGMIKELPHAQSVDELAESLLIGTVPEVIDKLAPYAELGIDRVILNANFGCPQNEALDMIQRFAEEVMPEFTSRPVGPKTS